MIFTVEGFRNIVREIYVSDDDQLTKREWLKLGLATKTLIDNNEYFEFDEADEEFKKIVFKKMEEL